MSAQGNCTTDALHCRLYCAYQAFRQHALRTPARIRRRILTLVSRTQARIIPKTVLTTSEGQKRLQDCLYIRTEQQHYEQATAETVAWLSDYPYRSTSVYVMCGTGIHSLAAYASHDFAHMQSSLNVSCCCFGHAVVFKMHANH